MRTEVKEKRKLDMDLVNCFKFKKTLIENKNRFLAIMHRLEKLCFVPFSNEFTCWLVHKFCQLIMNTSVFKFYVVEVRFHVSSVKI